MIAVGAHATAHHLVGMRLLAEMEVGAIVVFDERKLADNPQRQAHCRY